MSLATPGQIHIGEVPPAAASIARDNNYPGQLVGKMAGYEMIRLDLSILGYLLRAHRLRKRASGVEDTCRWRIGRTGDVALKDDSLPGTLELRVGNWYREDQRPRVGMRWWLSLGSSEFHPRIDEGDQQISDQHGQRDSKRQEQHGPLDDRIIATLDRA